MENAMKRLLSIIACWGILLASPQQGNAADLSGLVPSLKAGGYVIVFRHVATDDSQKDVYPFKFDDMTAQRQLSEAGRQTARQLGAAIKHLGVPVGEVYTSRLNRAVETGKLLAGKDVSPMDELTDSGAGSASSMANPDAKNAKAGRPLRDLANATPKTGLNTLVITHKTNIADAFGKDFSDVREGEALVFKPNASGPSVLVTRVHANEWIALAGS
jgi:phosphohistidine phosphatase SixA